MEDQSASFSIIIKNIGNLGCVTNDRHQNTFFDLEDNERKWDINIGNITYGNWQQYIF